ncbi:protein-tyrosine phosphatase-like protein [Suillus clintonianus]|uniref:protein-tyrosine phosphatase-like protein n=1 Tax=Suillus clintonianus TaxID=1904413 RepID=UPI001B881CCF|nr:protein-tyrosine phosphatase-like protein [Suillus clintonianus]KAG2147985.1 protein-tyrosine phosphatase-like protein [Suillus clintonianus]
MSDQSVRRHSKNNAAVLAVPPYIFLGPYTSASRSFIDSVGITHIISIGRAPVCPNHPHVQYHRLQLLDKDASSIYTAIDRANQVITDARNNGGKVLVHCVAGVSRSPTIIAAYLISRCSVSLKDALGLLVRARPAVCPRQGFIAQLKDLEIRARGCCSLDVDVLPGSKEARLALLAG